MKSMRRRPGGEARQSICLRHIRKAMDSQLIRPQPDASKQVCFEVDGELMAAGHAGVEAKLK
jgi:hypothetical protein